MIILALGIFIRRFRSRGTINAVVEAEIGKSELTEGLLAAVTRSLAPANTISWLSVSFVLISACRDLWGKKTVQGPHMFSEQAGTSCPCYRAWHISSKTELSLDTLCDFCRTQDLLKPPLNLPLGLGGELLPGAPWWPFLCSYTPLGQGESSLK